MEGEDCGRRSLPTFCGPSTKRWLPIGTKLASAWPFTASPDPAQAMTTTNAGSIPLQQPVAAMNLAAPTETRPAVGVRRWAACIARILLPAALFAIALFGVVDNPAHAAPAQPNPHSKLARDLQAGIDAGTTPAVNWARDIKGARYVQVIVVSNAVDPEMTALRAFVLRTGGSVLAKHAGIHALTVLMKAGTVNAMAQRKDVVSVSPNREVRRTASTLESITGALTSNVRSNSSKTGYSGVDGSGIGIAVLDSGGMKAHDAFLNDSGVTRVARNVDMFNSAAANWTIGVDITGSLMPGSLALSTYEAQIVADNDVTQDPFGHGTHVAATAAGYAKFYASSTPDSTGIAPNATLYDVRVLDDHGYGTVSDAIEGIQWVIYHAKEYNIRVLNTSLAADSTESWQTDPLCIAARSATAAGITVVAAAGNFGQSSASQELYGTVGAPGIDPSVITVGAVNYHDSVARDDDTVANFSSRGPTRGVWFDATGIAHHDNLLKPDLVAPGNKIVSAAATTANSGSPTWNYMASTYYSNLVAPLGITEIYPETQMQMSGTSIAAPAVTGAVALMLQANPGLTPPLIKAILQYTAQPLPNYNLLQQGAGMLNIDGAIVLANALRTDIAAQIDSNSLNAGTSMLAPYQWMPAQSSTINGHTFNWSRIAFVGGNQVVSGSRLFTQYQPIWDPRITWAGNGVRKRVAVYWSGAGIAANTYVQYFTDDALANQTLITSGVVGGNALAGSSSLTNQTGIFIPSLMLSYRLIWGGA